MFLNALSSFTTEHACFTIMESINLLQEAASQKWQFPRLRKLYLYSIGFQCYFAVSLFQVMPHFKPEKWEPRRHLLGWAQIGCQLFYLFSVYQIMHNRFVVHTFEDGSVYVKEEIQNGRLYKAKIVQGKQE